MYIAVLLRKMKAPKALESVYLTFLHDTAEEAASQAEEQATAYHKNNHGDSYRVVVGKMTHTIEPPEIKVTLKPLSE